jgi:hypothetical protein
MLHQNVLLAARCHKLEEQLAAITKRKTRKRKWIQKGGTMVYGEAAALATTERLKKACGDDDREAESWSIVLGLHLSRRCASQFYLEQHALYKRHIRTPSDLLLHQL